MKAKIIFMFTIIVIVALFSQFNTNSSNDLRAFKNDSLETKASYNIKLSNDTEPRSLGSIARWAGKNLVGGAFYDAAKAGMKRSKAAAKKIGKGSYRKQDASAGYSACY